MLQKEKSLGYIYRLAKESDKMLQATLANDTQTMEKSYRMFTTQKHRFYRIIMKQSYQQL